MSFEQQSQQYLYWDASNQIYLPVESNSTQTSKESKKDNPKDPKADKVKIAKKIAKDMEKWAKTLNQKKETSRYWTATEPVVNIEPTQSSLPSKSTSPDSALAIMEAQISNLETESTTVEPTNSIELKSSLDNKNQTFLNPFQIIRDEENRLTDWEKLACLLCKRQFSSAELLTKHQQLSDLHKVSLLIITNKFKEIFCFQTNLNVLKHQKLTDEQIEELDRTEREVNISFKIKPILI